MKKISFLLFQVLVASGLYATSWTTTPPSYIEWHQAYTVAASYSHMGPALQLSVLKNGALVASGGMGGSNTQYLTANASYSGNESTANQTISWQAYGQYMNTANGQMVTDGSVYATTYVGPPDIHVISIVPDIGTPIRPGAVFKPRVTATTSYSTLGSIHIYSGPPDADYNSYTNAQAFAGTTTATATVDGNPVTAGADGSTYTFYARAETSSPKYYSAAYGPITFTVQGINDSTFVSPQSVPSVVYTGQVFPVSQTWQNTGSKTWSTASNYNLGAQNPQDNGTWGAGRYAQAGAVAPNATQTYTFNLTAPGTVGAYNFQSRMVQDGVEWFGAYSPNVAINVANRPTVAITADQTTIELGQSTTIRASFATDSAHGDAMGGTNIDYPLGTALNDSTAQPSRTYAFSPSSTGTYTFYARMYTTASNGWQTYGTVTVTVVPRPSASISAGQPTIYVGQNTTISASFASDSAHGDSLGGTNIDMPLGTGLGDGSAQATRSYTFSPTAVGTYTFYARMYTTLSGGWQTYGSVTVTVANRAPDAATINVTPNPVALGASLALTGTLHDPDGNLTMHSFWRRGPRNTDTFSQDQNDWVRDADNTTGWSNHPNPGTPSDGTSSSISGTFTPWAAGWWQFQSNGSDSNGAGGVGASSPSIFVAPKPTVAISLTVPGFSAVNGGASTVAFVGDVLAVTNTASSTIGYLSEQQTLTYTGTTSPSNLASLGDLGLAAQSGTTASTQNTSWTVSAAGTYTVYAEAFTGVSSQQRANGDSGWPSSYNNASLRVTVNARGNPTGTLSFTDGSHNLWSPDGSNNVNVPFGASFFVRIAGQAGSNGALGQLLMRAQHGSTYAPDGVTVSGASASNDFGDPSAHTAFVANEMGAWTVWGHVMDASAIGWSSVSPWDGNHHGWATLGGPNLVVVKATPTWSANAPQTWTGSHLVTQADLTAAFGAPQNPYTTAVTSPSGTTTYAITAASGAGASPTGTLTPGTTVLRPGVYTVTASYAGDGNYNAATASRSFTVNNVLPTGFVDSITPSATVPVVTGTGWAADPDDGSPVSRVEIRIDGTTVMNATLGGSRTDVANAYGRPDYANCGWSFSYDVTSVAAGTHTVTAVAYDTSGGSAQLGNSFPFTRAAQPTVTSADATIALGAAFTPTYGGGAAGAGAWQFAIASYTNYPGTGGIQTGAAGTLLGGSNALSSSWTPSAPGKYLFWVRKAANASYAEAYSDAHYVWVKVAQPTVSSVNATGRSGQAFTPVFTGGSGSGPQQFEIDGQSGWPTGGQSGTGANGGSWTPTAPGKYTFYIRQLGDDGHYDSNVAGPYNLIVADASVASGDGGTLPANWPDTAGTDTHAVGLTAGQLSVDHSGALTYSVPLWVSPGTAGMEPKLALNYSSQGGAGIAGFGWSVSGVSAISRGGTTKFVDGKIQPVKFTSDDAYYMDGQRLIVINGTNGADGSEYRTEIDSFVKVVAHGTGGGQGPLWFEAWTKAGLHIEFGHTTDSIVAAEPYAPGASTSPGMLSWSVNKISDSCGNYMTFTYNWDSANREQTLARIDYTGNDTATPALATYASVAFTYDAARPDHRIAFYANSRSESVRRLTKIECSGPNGVARTYSLSYTQQPVTNWSLLSSLTETDGPTDATTGQPTTGHHSYPPLTFTYSQHDASNMGWQALGSSFVPAVALSRNGPSGTGFVDLDGDGRPDLVKNLNGDKAVWLNTPTGFVQQPSNSAWQLPLPLGADGAPDQGARFLDINGDGKVDFVNAGWDATNRHVWFNTGTGWSRTDPTSQTTPAAWDVPDKVSNSSGSSAGGIFVDIDGDGRPDLVESNSDKNGVYHNTPNGWSAFDSSWALPVTINDGTGADNGVRFVDLNGDGLPDLLVGRAKADLDAQGNFQWITYGAWLNTGSGWQDATLQYGPKEPLVRDSYPVWGVELTDVNGDGLTDFVCNHLTGTTTYKETWLNKGNGWYRKSEYDTPANLANCSNAGSGAKAKAGSALIDLTGDGLPAQIWSRYTPAGVYQYGYAPLLSNGFIPNDDPTQYNLVLQNKCLLAYDSKDSVSAQFVDLDADGAPDLVWNISDAAMPTNFPVSGALRNTTPRPNLLTSVTNGFGVKATVTYAPLTEKDSSGNFTIYDRNPTYVTLVAESDAISVISPTYVVKTVSNDDGVGGQYAVNYSYGGLRADVPHGSLGFQVMKVTDARTSVTTMTSFDQQYPFIGMPLHVTTSKSDGTVIGESETTYTSRSLNGNSHDLLVYSDMARQETDELDGTFVSATQTNTTQVDDYGNVLSMTVQSLNADYSFEGYSKTTTSTFTNDTTHWYLGRLTGSSVESKAPNGSDITRTSSFEYDANTGLLTKEIVEPNDTGFLKLTTTYSYDGYGNKTSVTVTGNDVNSAGATVPATRTTSMAYESRGRFVASTTNALGHAESYTCDQNLGVVTALTGPNNLTTSWIYDGFGTKIQETRADNTTSHMTIKWAGAGAPAGAKYFVETTVDGGAPSLVFHDNFGRTIESIGLDGNGQMVYQDTAYDNMSRAYATTVPYRSGDTKYWTQTTAYDLLNRPLTVQTPDDMVSGGYVTTTYTYKGLTTEVTDPKGRVARSVKNSQGWVIKSIRDVNGTAAEVDTDYDALGNPTSTTAASLKTKITYNLRGLKLSTATADMGKWTYSYNAFGELVSQTDAKSQTTRMAYDALGRLIYRNETEGTTTWTYDTLVRDQSDPQHVKYWLGKLAAVAAPGGYAEAYTYDGLGRPSTISRTIDGTAYTTSQVYDSYSRPWVSVYPTGFETKNVYNAFGFIKQVRRTSPSSNGTYPDLDLFWQADSYAVDGRVDGDTMGNGLTGDRYYSRATGRLYGAAVGLAPYSGTQFLMYTYDAVGNVLSRNEAVTGRNESFVYDSLDRLTSHTATVGSNSTTVTVSYDAMGNITNKSDVGDYTYDGTHGGPHAVTGIANGPLGAQSYVYDADGNMTSGAGRTLTWTSYNQVQSIVQGSYTTTFSFGADHERVKQVAHLAAGDTTTLYVGGAFELVTTSSGTEEKNYVLTPAGRVAVYTTGTYYASANVKYFHTDGLGSIVGVSDGSGNFQKGFVYDAWGKRTLDGTTAVTSLNNGRVTRGYTDHEELDDFGLIHMNGRVYDPVLGRFLSADPNIDGVYDSQGYNRYSYVGNNPMNRTDPSGYFSLGDALVTIVAVVVTAVVTVYTFGGAAAFTSFGSFFSALGDAAASAAAFHGIGLYAVAMGGAAGGFAGGFSGSLLNGGSIGDAFRAGVIGGLTGAATALVAAGIGGEFDALDKSAGLSWGEDWGGRAIAHGLADGAISEAEGGNFRSGFYSGAFASAAAPLTHVLGGYKGDWHIAERTAIAAAIGGTASRIGGGKFANGAVTGAFVHLFNDEAREHYRGKREAIITYKFGDNAADFSKEADVTASAGTGSIHITAFGVADAIEKVSAEADANGKFDRIVFDDHGSKATGPVFDRQWPWILASKEDGAAAMMQKLSSALKPNGTIWFASCSSAGPIAQGLATRTGHVVLASTTPVDFWNKSGNGIIYGVDIFEHFNYKEFVRFKP